MLNLIDEFNRECLANRVDPRLRSTDVIDVLSDLFVLRGVPDHIRSDNGPEFIAKAVRDLRHARRSRSDVRGSSLVRRSHAGSCLSLMQINIRATEPI